MGKETEKEKNEGEGLRYNDYYHHQHAIIITMIHYKHILFKKILTHDHKQQY